MNMQRKILVNPPSASEARFYIQRVLRFLESSENATSDDIDMCLKLEKSAEKISMNTAKQKSILDFFKKK